MSLSSKNQYFPFKFIQNLLIVVFISLLVLIVLNQANPLTTNMGRDSGMFAYVASYLLRGEVLYEHAWENKPPLLFFINAFGLWIGKGTRWGIWLMEFIFLVGASLTGFHALKKQFGIGPATFSSIVWLLGLNLVLSGGNFTEEYSLLFSFIAISLFVYGLNHPDVRWIYLLIGILLGLNFMLRANNIGVQLAIIFTQIILAISQKKALGLIKALALAGLGFIIPIALIAIYFISNHSLQLFLQASFLYNLFYSAGNSNFTGAFLSGLHNLGFAGGIALVGFGIAAKNLRQQVKNKDFDPFTLLICINFPLEVMLSGLSGRNYAHYFICWLPVIAISTAYLIQNIFPGITHWPERKLSLLPGILIAAILFTQSNLPAVYWESFSQIRKDPLHSQKRDLTAEYVNAHTKPNETVLIWGGQYGINFLAKRHSPAAYLFYPLYVPSRYTDKFGLEHYQAVTSHPPVMIVDGSYYVPEELLPLADPSPEKWLSEHNAYQTPYLREFLKFFRQNYSYETTIGGVAIYRLNR